MPAEKDPLSQVYDGMWAMLRAHQGFNDLVRVGNQINFSGDARNPLKAEITDTDLPEVRIIPAAANESHLQVTSNTGHLTQRFEVQVSTGDQRVDTKDEAGINSAVYPVVWEILRAMSGWSAVLRALTWGERTFVTLAKPTALSIAVDQSDLNRGIIGWSAKWTYEVQLHFPTSAIQPEPVT
jgi:hypothetical protein